MMYQNLALFMVAGGFLFMGLAAVVTPGRVVALFDIAELSLLGRSEVRAVYGGFGVAMAALLIYAGDLL